MEKVVSKTELEEDANGPDPPNPPPDTGKVYFWLIVCSLMMFTLPFAAFFLVKHYLKEYFNLDDFQVNCWSTFAAVLVVNLIICFYAYLAYLEDKNDHPPTPPPSEKKRK